MKAWVHAFRLRTLPLSLSGIIVGSGVAYTHGFFKLPIFILALLTTVLFQVLSNLANDLGDTLKGADNKDRVGPERAVQSGAISIAEMKSAVIITSILSLIAAAALIFVSAEGKGSDFWIIYGFLALFCVLAAITYTMGKKAYGYFGLGDVFVFIFFGLVSVIGVYYLYPLTIEISRIPWQILLPAIAMGCLSVAVLNLNNMRDRINDARVGKRTLVVKIGGNFAKLYHAIICIIAIASMYIWVSSYYSFNKWMYVFLIPGVFLIIHMRTVMATTTEKAFDPELKKVALIAFGLSVLFWVALLME